MNDRGTKNVCVDTHEKNSPSVNCAEVNAMHDYGSISDKDKRLIELMLERQINEQLYASGVISREMYETARRGIENSMAKEV